MHRRLAAKRVDQASACEARIEKATARLKQLLAELASPMAGQITSKDREDLKKLQVQTLMRLHCQCLLFVSSGACHTGSECGSAVPNVLTVLIGRGALE